ncbi:MAG: hypothetical protein AAFQ83_05975 [Bacteroidota bacterium]
MEDFSGDFKRLKRLIKSVIPRFTTTSAGSRYRLEDAKVMINDLGLQMSPETLAKMLSRDDILDDFLMSIHELERDLKQKVITDFYTIDPLLAPKVYDLGKEVGFTIISRKGEEIVFAEYTLDEDKLWGMD